MSKAMSKERIVMSRAKRKHSIIIAATILLLSLFTAGSTYAQAPRQGSGGGTSNATDPGILTGSPGAGKPFTTGLTVGDLAFFDMSAAPTFSEIEAVVNGLGPRFNLDSCAGCHAFPAVGGSSPP